MSSSYSTVFLKILLRFSTRVKDAICIETFFKYAFITVCKILILQKKAKKGQKIIALMNIFFKQKYFLM